MTIESVFLSCKVKKYNQYEWKHDRIFVVTEKHVYNIRSKSINIQIIFIEVRRKIPINTLAALTVSKDPQSQELVVHIIGAHDLRLKSSKYVTQPFLIYLFLQTIINYECYQNFLYGLGQRQYTYIWSGILNYFNLLIEIKAFERIHYQRKGCLERHLSYTFRIEQAFKRGLSQS